MADEIPRDLMSLCDEQLEHVRHTTDAQLTPLFRRWPALDKRELAELRRLYAERLRLARHLGFLRKKGLRDDGAASYR
jgi:hypothetical protein